MNSVSSFFGNNTMLEVLMIWKLEADNSENASMALMRSSLMISQQERKKEMEKPSGPGALSAGMSSIASLISSSENGSPRSSKGWAMGLRTAQLKSSWRGGGR